MRIPLFQAIARELYRYQNAVNRDDIAQDARAKVESLVKQFMPSGSGIDSGTELDFDRSKPEKLVFMFGFHHMDEHGSYCGWTHHTLFVKPSLVWGIEASITGRNRNDIKSYLLDTYMHALRALVEDGTTLVSKADEAVSIIRTMLAANSDGARDSAAHTASNFIARLNGDFSQ